MKHFLKILFLLLMVDTALYSAPARRGVISFEQPDGTTFNGILRGDASFHWIESDANIVLFNPKDKYYYKAKVTQNGHILLSKDKIKSLKKRSIGRNKTISAKDHYVSKEKHQALMKILKESKKKNYPR